MSVGAINGMSVYMIIKHGEVIEGCLERDKVRRWTIKMSLAHEYLVDCMNMVVLPYAYVHEWWDPFLWQMPKSKAWFKALNLLSSIVVVLYVRSCSLWNSNRAFDFSTLTAYSLAALILASLLVAPKNDTWSFSRTSAGNWVITGAGLAMTV